jgi:hypothetical protein
VQLTKKLAVMLGTSALGLGLLGGAALAALAPSGAQTFAEERHRPPAGKLEELLAGLVAEGKLTSAQQETILTRLRELTAKVEATRPERKTRVDVHRLIGDATRAAVAYLGLDQRTVGEQLRAGKSLADLVPAGKTREGLIAAVAGPAKAKAAELASARRLTAEESATLSASIDVTAAKIVDRKGDPRKSTAPGPTKQRP